MKNGKSINQKSYPLTRYGFICAVSRMESSSDLSLPLSAPVNIRPLAKVVIASSSDLPVQRLS